MPIIIFVSVSQPCTVASIEDNLVATYNIFQGTPDGNHCYKKSKLVMFFPSSWFTKFQLEIITCITLDAEDDETPELVSSSKSSGRSSLRALNSALGTERANEI